MSCCFYCLDRFLTIKAMNETLCLLAGRPKFFYYITLFNSGVVLEEAVALIAIKFDIRLSHNPVYLELQDRVNHFLKFCKSFLEILHYFLTKFSHVAKLCNILTKFGRVDFFVNLLIMTCYEICYQSVTFFFMMNTKNLNRS